MSSKLEGPESGPPKSRKKKKNREREFLVDLRGSFEEAGAFWHKIGDAPIFGGMKTRFTDSKPFDAMAIYKGVAIAIEAKYISDYKAFGVKTLRPSQIDGLESWSKSGGRSFIFLNIRRMADKLSGTTRMNRMMIFEYEDLKYIGRNMKKVELLDIPYVEGKKGRFDISRFLEMIERDV